MGASWRTLVEGVFYKLNEGHKKPFQVEGQGYTVHWLTLHGLDVPDGQKS